jgi:chemotaxis signal transduction protein
VLVVQVAGARAAWPVQVAHEVVRRPVTTPLPGAPSPALGLINVRGAIVTLLDGGALLAGVMPPVASRSDVLVPEGPPRDDASRPRRGLVAPWVVLLAYRGHTVGVSVDAVLGVHPLARGEDGYTAAGAGDTTATEEVVWQRDPGAAIAELAGARVLLLDADALLAHVVLSSEDER